MPIPKKNGLGIMIAVGKSGSSPPPRYKAPDAKQEEAPREAPDPSAKPEIAAPMPAESKDSSEYGKKLLSDMMAPLTSAGLEESDAKEMLAQIFDAAAACLREKSETPAMEGEESGGFAA